MLGAAETPERLRENPKTSGMVLCLIMPFNSVLPGQTVSEDRRGVQRNEYFSVPTTYGECEGNPGCLTRGRSGQTPCGLVRAWGRTWRTQKCNGRVYTQLVVVVERHLEVGGDLQFGCCVVETIIVDTLTQRTEGAKIWKAAHRTQALFITMMSIMACFQGRRCHLGKMKK